MEPEALAELAASIRTRGILQPILARPHPGQAGIYQIIAGERRWRAAQQAGLHEVPVHIRMLDDGDAMAAAPGREPAAPGSECDRGGRGPAAADR